MSWAGKNLFPETKFDPMHPVPELLTDFKPEKLDHWLSFFVVEVCRQDKQPYPLFNLVAGVQHFICDGRQCNDLDYFGKNSKVPRMRKALDCHMKELTAEGIGVNAKHADAVTLDDERFCGTVVYST